MDANRSPLVLNLRLPAVCAHCSSLEQRANAIASDVPSMCVGDELFEALTSDYVRWCGVPASAGTRGFQRRAVNTESAAALCRRNSRFLLGLLHALGYDSPHPRTLLPLSLDLFACESVMTTLLAVVDARSTKGHRKYLELRHLVHYVFDRARRELSPLGQAALALASLPAFQAVDGAITSACAAKKLDERKDLGRREEDLVAAGRWLTDADRRFALDRAVLAFVRRAPGASVSPGHAFDYQNHLIVHWLNGNSLPVFRSEVFCQLRVHDTIRRSDNGSHWIIEFTGENIALTKTRQLLLARLPPADSAFVETWLYQMRPLLVSGEVSAIRAYTSRQITERYIGSSVWPHAFRAMQATESQNLGISPQEHKAMCAGRQHSTATAERFYERRSLKRSANQAADHLAELRASRQDKRRKLQHPSSAAAVAGCAAAAKREPPGPEDDSDDSSSSGSAASSSPASARSSSPWPDIDGQWQGVGRDRHVKQEPEQSRAATVQVPALVKQEPLS